MSRTRSDSSQNAWRSSSSLSENDASASHITNIIRRLNTILEEESRKAAPHSCLIYTASTQIYIIIAKLALSSTSRDLISAATQFFHFLINGEVESVLDSKIFARSLIDLVKRCIAPATKVVNEEEESALIELLFEICTKIRLDPGILPAWFYPERVPSQQSVSVLDARKSQFPLFHLLIDYVHYDGSIGDFARMALLYLTEAAPRSPALEKWMMESDLAHQMASVLSALYGRLSRLAPNINKSALPILAYSDGFEEGNVMSFPDEERGQDMRALLAYLQFWQDALSRCQSMEVRDTLLDSFQVLFVEQLLYPSLLESSDVEGGSTSAVILHLCSLLEALENPQLIDRMLSYLFAVKSQPALSINQKARQRMSMSRRKSVEQLASLAQIADNPSPDLFSLLDLIVFSLRSSQPQTVTASLRLLTVLLRRHHPCVRNQLFTLEPMAENARQNLNNLNHVMMTLFDYASVISPVSSIDQSYQAALQDAQIGMEHHSCLIDESVRTSPDLSTWVISSNCKVMEQTIVTLSNWFSNDTLVNLELTGMLTNLATCEYVLMRSWLAPTDEVNNLQRSSNIIGIIEQLVEQVKQWRSQFVEWDAFYSIQRVNIASEDDASNSNHSDPSRTASKTLPADKASLKAPAPPSRSSSNRGTSADIASPNTRPIIGKASDRTVQQQYPSGQSQSQHSLLEQTATVDDVPDVLTATLLETRIPVKAFSTNQIVHGHTQSGIVEEVVVDEPVVSSLHANESGENTNEESGPDANDLPTASLRHLLTQAIILQEFILEMAAALQIRATLFDEVDLS